MDALALALVLLIWAGAQAAALLYVARHATQQAFLDDLTVVETYRPDRSLTPGHLWSQHNEHRIPLLRPLLKLLVVGSGGFRAAAYFDQLLLGGIVLGLVLTARHLRGRASLLDAFFPLAWLHLGHHENLLHGFQVVLITPAALLCALLGLILWREAVPGLLRLLAILACLLALTLCGFPGLVPAVGFLPYLLWLRWHTRASARLADRRVGGIALAGVAAVVGLVALTFLGFRFLEGARRPGALAVLRTALQFHASWMGDLAREHWPGAALAALAASGTIAACILAGWRQPRGRARVAGLTAFLLGGLLLCGSIGVGRGPDNDMAGTLSRYGHIGLPFVSALYLATILHARGSPGVVLQGALLAGAVGAYAWNARPALALGARRVELAAALERDVAAGRSTAELAALHWRSFGYSEEMYREALQHLRVARLPPFERPEHASEPRRAPPPFHMLTQAPHSASAGKEIQAQRIDSVEVLLVHAPGELRFALDGRASAVRGAYGLHPLARATGRSDGVHFQVELQAEGRTRTLFSSALEGAPGVAEPLLHDFAVDLPPGARGELVLRTFNPPDRHDDMDWAFWTRVEILEADATGGGR